MTSPSSKTQVPPQQLTRPSRRVIELTLIALLCGAVIVVVALLSLISPRDSISELDRRVIPASTALTRVENGNRDTQELFRQALASPPDARGPIIAESQAASSRAASAWKDYRRLSFDSPAERRLQQSYVDGIAEGQAAGADAFGLVDSPDRAAFDAALTAEEVLSTKNLATVNAISQRFYSSRVQRSVSDATASLDRAWIWVLLAFALVLVVGLTNAAVQLRGAYRDERILAGSAGGPRA